MLRYARFALLVGLAAAIPVVSQQQGKQETKGDNKKKAEPSKKDSAAKNKDAKDKDSDERLDRRNSRMKERNREIDRILNKPKK